MRRRTANTRSRQRTFALVLLVLATVPFAGCTHDRLMGDAGRISEPRPVQADSLDAGRKIFVNSDRLVALLVLGGSGTEVFDLLAPAEILSASGAFDVFTVARDRQPKPLTGGIAIVPDFSLDEAPPADLILMPAVREPAEPALVAWLRTRSASDTQFLSVCEGARLAGEAGLLDGRRVTTHFFALDALQEKYPGATFSAGHRYVVDGRLITTAGVSAAVDGALFALARMAGRDVARETARELELDWREESDPAGHREAEQFAFSFSEVARLAFNTIFLHRSDRVGVVVTPGISEIALAAAFDTFPRSLRAWQTSLSLGDAPVPTRHGFRLIAEQRVETAAREDFDLWILPSGSSREAEAWARRVAPDGTPVISLATESPGRALASQLRLVAEYQGAGTASAVARMLELPWDPTAD